MVSIMARVAAISDGPRSVRPRGRRAFSLLPAFLSLLGSAIAVFRFEFDAVRNSHAGDRQGERRSPRGAPATGLRPRPCRRADFYCKMLKLLYNYGTVSPVTAGRFRGPVFSRIPC